LTLPDTGSLDYTAARVAGNGEGGERLDHDRQDLPGDVDQPALAAAIGGGEPQRFQERFHGPFCHSPEAAPRATKPTP
jgi:hypothetical protein